MSKSEASRVFTLSRNTIDLWLKRREETGDVQAKQGYQQGSRQKVTDWEQFRQFIRMQGSKTQAEIAQIWEGDISRRTVGRALHKIGFTRKKRPMAIVNGTKPNGKRS